MPDIRVITAEDIAKAISRVNQMIETLRREITVFESIRDMLDGEYEKRGIQ